MIEVVVCRTGMSRHAPTLPDTVTRMGCVLATVECFDKCDTCERFLLARLDGATARFRDAGELVAALEALMGQG